MALKLPANMFEAMLGGCKISMTMGDIFACLLNLSLVEQACLSKVIMLKLSKIVRLILAGWNLWPIKHKQNRIGFNWLKYNKNIKKCAHLDCLYCIIKRINF